MGNVLDYMVWRGDLTFAQSPFNDVDSLILAEICYIDFANIVPTLQSGEWLTLRQVAVKYVQQERPLHLGYILPDEIIDLFLMAADSVRFGAMGVTGYVNEIDLVNQRQFSATTFLPSDGTAYVAFRGTDDTMVGWKEDFNMSFLMPVPAQEYALDYLNQVAERYPVHPLRVGGHSKGGNLAVYSSMEVPATVQNRILDIYNCDGPGFTRAVVDTEHHRAIAHKIKTIVPQSSVIGMLLEHEEHFMVVESGQVGILQHDGFSWEVAGTHFTQLDDVTEESKEISRTLRGWAGSMTEEERADFVDVLFSIINPDGVETVSELNAFRLKSATAALHSLTSLDENSKKAISKIIATVFRDRAKSLYGTLRRPWSKYNLTKERP